MTGIVRPVPDDQRMIEPGVYVEGRRFAIFPLRSKDNHEVIPFSWASELSGVGEFVLRFPQYWVGDAKRECWVSRQPATVRDGVYWCTYDPRQGVKP